MADIGIELSTGEITGPSVSETLRTVADMKGYYLDESARDKLNARRVVYRVQAFSPVEEEVEGGLFLGNTSIEPGLVGDEYFMTKGHFHRNPRGCQLAATLDMATFTPNMPAYP